MWTKRWDRTLVSEGVKQQKYLNKKVTKILKLQAKYLMFTSICRNHVILQNVVKCRLMMIFSLINTNQKKG